MSKQEQVSYLATLEPRKIYERLKLVWGLYKDDRVSKFQKLVLLVGLAYVAFPIDLIPDFIPGLGMVDDLIVAILVADWFINICPPDVVKEHRSRIETGESDFDEDIKTLVYLIRKEFYDKLGRWKKQD